VALINLDDWFDLRIIVAPVGTHTRQRINSLLRGEMCAFTSLVPNLINPVSRVINHDGIQTRKVIFIHR
jgi:hypothetical protein